MSGDLFKRKAKQYPALYLLIIQK